MTTTATPCTPAEARLSSTAAAVALALGCFAWAPTANAEGRCLFQGDWNCYGPPQYNGTG